MFPHGLDGAIALQLLWLAGLPIFAAFWWMKNK